MPERDAQTKERRWPLVAAVVAACLLLTAAAVLALYGGFTRAMERMARVDAHHVVTAIQLHNAVCEEEERLTASADAAVLYQQLGGEEVLGFDRQRFERALPFIAVDEAGGARFYDAGRETRSSHGT